MNLKHSKSLEQKDNFMVSNDKEVLIHQESLRISNPSSLEQTMFLPIFRELSTFNAKGEPIATQKLTQIHNWNRRAHRKAHKTRFQCHAKTQPSESKVEC